MDIVDRGSGPALVLVPGIQGRWEYVRPTLDELARSFRVLTVSLSGEQASGLPLQLSAGLDNDTAAILSTLDRRRLDRALLCGISFGGLVALRFAAVHPERTSAVVLASTPGPQWRLRPRHELYARAPWIFGGMFIAETPFRLRRELAAALPRPAERWRFIRWQLRTLAGAPLSLSRIATRARLISQLDIARDCRRITAQALVVTGESDLDHVVHVGGTMDYLQLLAGARHAVLERTGHLGSITRPDQFARLVQAFVESAVGPVASREAPARVNERPSRPASAKATAARRGFSEGGGVGRSPT
jgi:pimeloyl-ACP methyl ester carboxylesterase